MVPIGDLTRGILLQSQSAHLKSRISALSTELTTGRVSNPRAHVSGQTGQLHAITHQIAKLTAFDMTAREIGPLLETQQLSMASIETGLEPVIQAALGNDEATFITASRQAFEDALSALKTDHAGHRVFTWTQGLPDAAQVITHLQTAMAQSPHEAPDIVLADTLTDLLTTPAAPPDVPIGDYQTLNISSQTAPDAVVQTLTSLARGFLDGSGAKDHNALQRAASELMSDRDQLVQNQADIGTKQNRLEHARVRNTSQRSHLEMAQNDLLGSDPFKAAALLKDAEFRLEALFTTTARLSQLSLTRFL
jgi:flagellar hook-associated protein 3 FlgL